MSVSCDCGGVDFEWFYDGPNDYTQLDTPRSRKCFSCGAKIKPGDDCGKFPRWRSGDEWNDSDRIKMRIYGDEIPLSTWWACETCAGLYFSITELGFCVTIGDDITMADNARMCGFSRATQKTPEPGESNK